MNESSLTEVHRRRLFTQVNPCFPTNVTLKTAIPDRNGPSPNRRLRVFWIIPNFRTSPMLVPYKPITPSEKFHIATLDSFDRGTVALGVLFGAEAGLTDANRSFGQGLGGYAHYFATFYVD
jgi:hypothetical protein